MLLFFFFFFFSSRRRHTRYIGDWSSDVCSSDLVVRASGAAVGGERVRAQGGRRRRDRKSVVEGKSVDIGGRRIIKKKKKKKKGDNKTEKAMKGRNIREERDRKDK